jgi:Arylsulfotransferase (ASST)
VRATRIAFGFAPAALWVACQSSSPDPGKVVDGADASANGPMQSLTISPLALTPAFSPSIHDYYVRCAAGSNALSVSMTAAEGATVALLEPSMTAPASSLQKSVVVAEDQAIVVSASLGSAATEYWVRCLPHTFPRLATSLHPAAGTVVPGYYLVGAIFFASGESGYAMALDQNGTPVWYGLTANGGGAKDVDLLAPNTISYVPIAGYTFGTSMGQFENHALDPVGVSFVTSVGIPVDTHEFRRLPNGDYLLFASPVTTGVDLTGLSNYGASEDILNGVIQEVTPGGQVVWQWTATDHFDPVKDTTWPQTSTATNLAGQNVTVIDPFHLNSIDVDASGNLLVSSRHMDSIFLISKATGQVLWKMGGSSYTKDGASFLQVTGDPMGGFHRQHDARFQPDGTISLFDDETSLPGPARAVVVSYDASAGTASIVWQHRGAASVGAMGSFTILPDGSRVIGWGTQEGGNPTFTEVTESGEDLLDFRFSDGDSSYRALKVPSSAIDLETLRNAVGPWSSSSGAPEGDSGQDSGSTADADAGGPSEVVGCSTVAGAGSTQQCTYSSSTAPGFSCASVAGSAAGSCPAAGLYGCCVETFMDAGAQVRSATCYYSSASGQPASSQCDLQAYQGGPYDWQTYAP